MPAAIERMAHASKVLIVVRGPDGRIRDIREGLNMKVYNTMNIIASMVANDPGTARTCNKLGIGESAGTLTSADTALNSETVSRTYGRFSHDAGSAMWNLSASFTAFANTVTLREIAILDSLTGGNLYLKVTFAALQVSSQDTLAVSFTQSLSSA